MLVAVAIFFAAGEAVTRATGILDRLNGATRRLFVATDDPRCPYTLRPGFDGLIRRGFRVIVNAQGLRTPPVSPEPPPGGHRVLALGDSATFGEGLDVGEAFPALLERDLQARTGERWEVLNGGVEGYNTEAELAFLERRGLAHHPEAVVVGFNLNDYDDVPVVGPHGILTMDRAAFGRRPSLAEASEFYLLLRLLVVTRGRLWRANLSVPGGTIPEGDDGLRDLDRYVSGLRKRYYRYPDDGRWQTLVQSLYGFSAAARRHGFRLVVAILPDGDQFGPEPDLLPQEKVLAVCAAAGLDCLDLRPAFAAAGGERLFLDISHPNAEGQRVIARVLADRLLERGD